MRRASHEGSARASTCPALYQCRLLALTLPTTTLLRSTTFDATSAVGEPDGSPAAPDARETYDAARRDGLNRICDDLPDAGAFDDDVRLESDVRDGAGVIGGPQGTDEIGLGPRLDPVEYVNLQPVLLADERGKKADRPGPGHEHGPRLPKGTLADGGDLLPRLGHDRRGLEQHA